MIRDGILPLLMDNVNNPARREKALRTRRKILEAAAKEFAENGFHGATIALIATRAGVAVQTVYFVFHTKPELISAVIDAAVMGDEPTIPQETAWWAAMVAESDPVEALRLFIRGAAPLFERASGLSEILRGAALTDDEVRATYDYHDQLRRQGFREVIQLLATKGSLKDPLDIESATDLFQTLYGDSTYALMTTERGWSAERWIEWLCEELPGLLLAPIPR